MTYLTDLTALVASASLPHLNGWQRGGARAAILDAFAREHIGHLEAFDLLAECDRRIRTEGERFGDESETTEQPETRPAPVPMPEPVMLSRGELEWCSSRRWVPDDPVPTAATLLEQWSRICNAIEARAIARQRGRDLEPRDIEAIWRAVCADLALKFRGREAA